MFYRSWEITLRRLCKATLLVDPFCAEELLTYGTDVILGIRINGCYSALEMSLSSWSQAARSDFHSSDMFSFRL